MKIKKYFYLYLTAIITFLILDFLWIGVIASGFYISQMGYLLRDQILWVPAIIFYLLFVCGLLFFSVLPSLKESSGFFKLLVKGGFFGLIAYSTYDLTCLAVIKDFPLTAAIVDMIWGAFIGAAVSAVAYAAGKRLV